MSGGRKGDSSITIKIEEATGADNTRSNVSTDRTDAGAIPDGVVDATISFSMPRLANVALAGANPKDPVKRVWLSATSRIISGSFKDGPLAGTAPYYVVPVIQARDSLTLAISDSNEKNIVIDGDSAFMSVKETIGAGKKAAGYVDLATVTITTRQMISDAAAAVGAKDVYKLQVGGKDGIGNTETNDQNVLHGR